jgi:NAD(P)-dependent dehydrogenase (short-subunit alcohol dehydrogenase family)
MKMEYVIIVEWLAIWWKSIKQVVTDMTGDSRINEIIEQIKLEGKGKKYDCVIGVSGGTDFSYMVYRAYAVINNTAINPYIGSAVLMSYDAIRRTSNINLFAPILICKEAVKLMSRKKVNVNNNE